MTRVPWKILILQFFSAILQSNAADSTNGSTPIVQSISSTVQSNSSTPKLVFAHFMAGLTLNYTAQDWKTQMQLAASHHIDAFAVNVGLPSDWQLSQVKTAYTIAAQIMTPSGTPFKLFLSLDMSVIQTAEDVTTWVTTLCPLFSQLLINSRPLVSTFSGEANNLGGRNLSDGWNSALKMPLAALNPPLNALFVPVWSGLNPTTAVTDNPVVDGIMTWLSWPSGNESVTMTTESVDLAFQKDSRASGKLYMAGVSPFFFTHYDYKNWIDKSDDNLYITRWKDLINMSAQPDFIEIISWNDYGESHYIGPQAGIPPANTTWIDGFDHQGFLNMSDYFIQWYKTGSPPAVQEDAVYFNYRPHSINAVATSDKLPRPENATFSVDAVYAAGFFTSNSTAKTVRISIGGKQQSFNNISLNSYSTFVAPWTDDGGEVVVAVLDGNGNQLMEKTGAHKINNNIKTYNFNYAVEMAHKSRAKSPASSLRPASLGFSLPIESFQSQFYINTATVICFFSTISTLVM